MKNKKNHLLLLLLLFSWNLVYAQYYNQRPSFLKANSQWMLGNWAINFNATPPQVYPMLFNDYTSPLEVGSRAFATAADPLSGQLRFFATCKKAYDRNYNMMPNGELSGNSTTSQNVCIVPFPDNPDRYYVFSHHFYLPWDNDLVTYSVVDMQLNNGLGDIDPAYRNLSLFQKTDTDSLAKNMIAIPGNNCDIWLVVQTLGKFRFSSYHITTAGIDPVPVVSVPDIPAAYPISSGSYNGPQYGPLCITPDRKIIAGIMPEWINPADPSAQDKYFLFLNRFDPETGELSAGQYILGAGFKEIYAAAFSPDCKKIFTCYMNGEANVGFNQYNISDTGLIDSSTFLGNVSLDYEGLIGFVHLRTPITMRSYGGNIYFNRSRDSSGIIENNIVSSFLVDNNGLGMIVNPNIQPDSNDADHGIVSNAIPLPAWCSGFFQPEVVYPFTAADTISDLFKDTVICNDMSGNFPGLSLKARQGFTDYIWNDGTVGQERNIIQEGIYWVFYKGSCNARVDTFIIRTKPMPDFLHLDTVVCEQRFPFDLRPLESGSSYHWSDGNSNDHMTIYQPGKFWLTTTYQGCAIVDSTNITSKQCGCYVSIPNAFSPNNDGINDYFKPLIAPGCVPAEYSLRIYDRWGQVVYSSFNEFDKGWDGTRDKGNNADAGTYFYIIKFRSNFLHDGYSKRGDLTLIR